MLDLKSSVNKADVYSCIALVLLALCGYAVYELYSTVVGIIIFILCNLIVIAVGITQYIKKYRSDKDKM